MEKKIEKLAQLITIVSYLRSIISNTNVVGKDLYKSINSLVIKLEQEIVKESLNSLKTFSFTELEKNHKEREKQKNLFSTVHPVSGIPDVIEKTLEKNQEDFKLAEKPVKKKFSVKRSEPKEGSDE